VNGDRPEGPLTGIRVLDLCRLLPGGFATALLGDLGADVVKVEQPGIGDHMRLSEPRLGAESAYSWVADRNKSSVALNLKDPRGKEAFHRLAAGADAVIESFRPGVVDRLGIGYEDLAPLNPALVYCSISGYGADGPRKLEAGHDVNYAGRAGVLSVIGVPERPVIPGVQLADIGGGGLMSIVGLLAALVGAQRTGHGEHVDLSMTDAAFSMLSIHLGGFFAEGRTPRREDDALTGRYPCYSVYACADGRHLTVGALELQFWRELCDGVGRPDLVDTHMDPGALPTWRAIFAGRARDEWLDLLATRDACVGPVNDFAEAAADAQLAHRGMVTSAEHPELGPLPQVGAPIKLRRFPAGAPRPAPPLGVSTRALLTEAGYDEDAIDALIADGVAAEVTGTAAPTSRPA
jgi:crotonobetainyl-CoA:carnitine CoA-transferase CaiB-like acyl-CoA transferase